MDQDDRTVLSSGALYVTTVGVPVWRAKQFFDGPVQLLNCVSSSQSFFLRIVAVAYDREPTAAFKSCFNGTGSLKTVFRETLR